MKKQFEDFVTLCTICQRTKYLPRTPSACYSLVPTPSTIWEDISIDFVTKLPACKGQVVILMVVDRFSKYAHFGTLRNSFTTCQVADLFTALVWQLNWYQEVSLSTRSNIHEQIPESSSSVTWYKATDEHGVPSLDKRTNRGL